MNKPHPQLLLTWALLVALALAGCRRGGGGGGRAAAAAGVTDEFGQTTLSAGGITVPVRAIDRETGLPVSGLSVALDISPDNPGRAAVVALDQFERYPVQFIHLYGEPSELGESSPNQVDPGSAPDDPVQLPIKRGPTQTTGLEPFITGAWESVPVPMLPPSSQPLGAFFGSTVFGALQSAVEGAPIPSTIGPPGITPLFSITDYGVVTGNEAINLVNGEAQIGFNVETLFELVSDYAFGDPPFSSRFASKLVLLGSMTWCEVMEDCQGFKAKKVTIGLGSSFFFFKPTPQVPPSLPGDTPLTVTILDPSGNPIPGALSEVISTTYEGLTYWGFGNKILVHQGNYRLYITAQGYLQWSQNVQVGPGGQSLVAMLTPLPPPGSCGGGVSATADSYVVWLSNELHYSVITVNVENACPGDSVSAISSWYQNPGTYANAAGNAGLSLQTPTHEGCYAGSLAVFVNGNKILSVSEECF